MIEAAAKLQLDHGWDPIYWSANYTFEKKVTEKFPGVIYNSSINSPRGIINQYFQNKPLPFLTEEFLKEMSPHETIILYMMQRYDRDGDSFSYLERLDHYHHLLRYSLLQFQELKPDLILFAEIPHGVADYVLYAVAKYLKIPYLTFSITSWPGYCYISPCEIEGDSNPILQKYNELLKSEFHSKKEFNPLITKFFNTMNGTYQEAKPWCIDFVDNNREYYSFSLKKLKLYLTKLNRISLYLKRFYGFNSPIDFDNYEKIKNISFQISFKTFKESKKSKVQFKKYVAEIRNYYHSLAIKPDINCSYVYLALHYQPELSTSPAGGYFGHQHLLVDTLRKNIPADWKIYVKEHPCQFEDAMPKNAMRNRAYYDKILSYPNTFLVDIKTNTFHLTDNAKAIATVVGTVGFEAICRGIPALIFGNVWYLGCEGTYYAASENGLKSALKDILSGKKVDPIKVQLFLQSLIEVGEYVWNKELHREYVKMNLTEEENIHRLVKLYNNAFNHYYKSTSFLGEKLLSNHSYIINS